VKAAERQVRDEDILRLFIAGATYRQIARALNCGLATVSRAVAAQLAAGQTRRELLSEEALAVHTERTERLFQAHWQKALGGDHRSAEICRKILAQQARLHGLEADLTPGLPAPTQHLGDDEPDDEGPSDELARIRAARFGA
jgi:hypothetical protein